MSKRRDEILSIVKREMIGPDPIDWEGYTQSNGEEVLHTDPPRTRYIAGILFPQETTEDAAEQSDAPDDEIEPEIKDELIENPPEIRDFSLQPMEFLEDAEELINRSNAYRQSAVSLTIATITGDQVNVEVSAGTYETKKTKDIETEKEKTIYPRTQLQWNNMDSNLSLPTKSDKIKKYSVSSSGLQLVITHRLALPSYSIYTFSLENTKKSSGSSLRDDDCFFQVKLALFSEAGFHPLPAEQKIYSDDDFTSNQLLYRHVFNYAIGHGCAADWTEEAGKVTSITTATFPSFDLKPIVPSTIPGVSLEMIGMTKHGNFSAALNELKIMCDKYEVWINTLISLRDTLEPRHFEAADRHIESCKSCLFRMRQGLNLLANNDEVREAFQLMNEAMLMQQLHYNLPLKKWKINENGRIYLNEDKKGLPDINDPSTWPGKSNRFGKWRPFQLAFVLINLLSMHQNSCDERSIVDLIWFPTGGGKTEAYLGLSAFTIFLYRLMKKPVYGSVILMRYTLRLLTAQQYERASSLICACEFIRSRNESILGSDRISIGLWVGSATTPNSMSEAISAFNKLYNGQSDYNPFVILKCPWCGAQMGVLEKRQGQRELLGYRKIRERRGAYKFIFCCNNEQCDFSASDYPLPLHIIDETIYSTPPTLLLGTVDKFAMLPYKPEAQSVFGIDNGVRISAPELIIQDELHLISGPLGSMVGHYETLINELCTIRTASETISPKIVASTATISRAKEQCQALYGCEKDKVFQFPPAGLNAGESFFAYEDKNQNGRRYIGIMATGSSSDATTAIRLYSALLYAAKKISVDAETFRDPYWTNVAYFNSIRELGQAATWIRADIEQHLNVMYKRRFDDKRLPVEEYRLTRRYIWRDEELTSRVTGDQLTSTLASLSISYPPETTPDGKSNEKPIDICLATNMISVGLDVQRLGLMTVNGQPKTTAEYIQSTSRVGRNSDSAPGIVFILYRPGRPRDKSHYEHFREYHSKIYSNVEPTSVTPFSSPVRKRALHAVLIALIRLFRDKAYNDAKPQLPDKETLERISEIVLNRIKSIDFNELENTSGMLETIIENWEDWNPARWTPGYNYQGYSESLPLMYSSGSHPNLAWGKRGFQTPTSMRNVDASCVVDVLPNRYVSEE